MAELIKVNAPVRKPLFEGVQGENEARSIQFDIEPWVTELGDGAVTATAKRSQDSQPYPVTVTKDGTTVTWKPTSTDTAFAGVGSFQLEYTVDSILAKTCIWSTMVAPSLDPAGDPPDPYDNWLAEMRQIAADAIQAAQDADESADDAQASEQRVSDSLSLFVDPSVKSANEFGNEWTNGGYIDPSTGNIVPASSYKYSDFYQIKSGTHRTLFVRASTAISGSSIVRYDASKTQIGSKSISNADYPIDDNVAYIRAYVPTSFTGDLYISTGEPSDPIDYTFVDAYALQYDSLPPDMMVEKITSDNKFSNYWTIGGYINTNTDAIESASTFKYTPKYIELQDGTGRTLYLKRTTGDGSIVVIRYDENYNILGFRSFSSGETSLNYEIDDNVKYLRCYVPTTFTGVLYISTKEPSAQTDYSYATDTVIKASKIEKTGEDAESTETPLTVVNFGDSIYGNFQGTSGDTISVSALIAKKTGYTVVNGGFGGCQMHQHHVAGWTPFSMYKLADAIVSGDWTEQDASWANRTELNLPYYFGTTIATLKAIDFSTVDIITIAYGTNDWSSGDTLVSPTQDPFDTNTFGGALRYTIKRFLEAYPTLKIVVQNPTPRFTIENNVITGTSDTDTNNSGDTLVDFIEEENTVCKEYKIPVIDAYYNSMFNVYTHDTYFNSVGDGVHLGLKGRQRLADMVSMYLLYQL